MHALVIGLDGVPRALVERLARDGVAPRLARLCAEGCLQDLGASVPEISAVSWSDFMTGADAGSHGIFGFTDLVAHGRKLRFPSFSDLAVPTLWDRLGKAGKRSVVLNQPATYPARAIPGALVSGFVALELDRAVHPARHLPALEKLGYRIDVETRSAAKDLPGLLAGLEATLGLRLQAALHLWQAEPWDLFEVVVTGTDRLQHFLWDALEEPGHPLHARVLEYYHAVDAFVGTLVDRFREEHPKGALFMLSDHGFTRARFEVNLNVWLEAEGYLVFRNHDQRSLADLDEATGAFALDPGRIYLTKESSTLAAELSQGLARLEHAGRPVLRAVHAREEIYAGPLLARAPHLVCQGADGFDLKGRINARELFAPPALPGMHDPHAFLWTETPLPGPLAIKELARHIEEACL